MTTMSNGLAGQASDMIETLLALLLSNSFSFLIGLAVYVLTALSLYTIARRRGINHPWLAWLPVANLWILGSISDQYQYVSQGLVRNRRKILLVLSIVFIVLWIALVALMAVAVVTVITETALLDDIFTAGMSDETARYVLETFLPRLLGVMGIGLAMCIVALVQSVFQYICYYNLFASCQPDNKVLYILLSIFINVTLPVFLMICRNKDLGMPPRKQPAAPASLPENF